MRNSQVQELLKIMASKLEPSIPRPSISIFVLRTSNTAGVTHAHMSHEFYQRGEPFISSI